jgi:hypothetical protein
MTVVELIKELKEFDPDAKVMVDDRFLHYEHADVCRVVLHPEYVNAKVVVLEQN